RRRRARALPRPAGGLEDPAARRLRAGAAAHRVREGPARRPRPAGGPGGDAVTGLGYHVLELDLEAEADRIAGQLRDATRRLRRRGLVVAISGGIDSSCCAALAVRALGADRVLGLILPERDSSGDSAERAQLLAGHLGIRVETIDIAPALEAIGCYRERD